ncbi:MAG: hypothetical protein HQL19_05470 [Candidatus Omnitrophica bacterium]|nr:hypothetical protein [Candidatus Omnitrophota bacterium]
MKKIFAIFLVLMCFLVLFVRPAVSAVAENERTVSLSLEAVAPALPAEFFVLTTMPVPFLIEYFEERSLARCLDGYFITSCERPPPGMA